MSIQASLHCIAFAVKGLNGETDNLFMVRSRAFELFKILEDTAFQWFTMMPVVRSTSNLYDWYHRYAPIYLESSYCNPTNDPEPQSNEPFLDCITASVYVRGQERPVHEINLVRCEIPASLELLMQQYPSFSRIAVRASRSRSPEKSSLQLETSRRTSAAST